MVFSLLTAGLFLSAAADQAKEVIEAGKFSAELPGSLPDGWQLVPRKTSGKRTVYRLVQDGDTVVLRAVSEAASAGLLAISVQAAATPGE